MNNAKTFSTSFANIKYFTPREHNYKIGYMHPIILVYTVEPLTRGGDHLEEGTTSQEGTSHAVFTNIN